MKTLAKIILILLFSVACIFSQSGWTVQYTGETAKQTQIYFINPNTGFSSGNPVLKTTNGGQNWIQRSDYNQFYTASFPNSSTGYFANTDLYKSTNCGDNQVNMGVWAAQQVQFLNPDTGFAGGWGNLGQLYINFYKTTDGANTWDSITYHFNEFCYSSNILSIFFLNANTGYYSLYYWTEAWQGGYGIIFKTTDMGNNWTQIVNSDSVSFYSMTFPTSDTGYCIGRHNTYWHPFYYYIYKCVNDNWYVVYTTPNEDINSGLTSISFVNASTGYAVGDAGLILKTTNGGINWSSQNSGVTVSLNSVCFLDQNTGYIAGNSGVILKTTTGGETITNDTVSGQVRFQDNNQNVSSGCVKALKYDSGLNQILTVDSTNIQSNGSYSLRHVPQDSIFIMAFENDEAPLLYVPTYYPSSINWQNATELYPTGNLNNINILVYRINNQQGPYHIGGHVYLNSQNPLSGLSGAILYAKVGNNFKSFSFSSGTGSYQIDSISSATFNIIVDRIGCAPLNRAVNITSYNKDTIDFYFNLLGVQKEGIEIPKNYWLGNNYPNPFNPNTTIKFGVSNIPFSRGEDAESGRGVLTSLKIYDILGREVTTLLDQKLQPGNYSVTWDASKYASGVYFYKLQAGDFVQTKKLVVLK